VNLLFCGICYIKLSRWLTKNVELDFNSFDSGSLTLEFLDTCGNTIGVRETQAEGNDERCYGFGEEFSSVKLTANDSDIDIASISGRGLPTEVTVEAGGLVPDFEAMEAAGISWSEVEYQEINYTDDITDVGDVGNSRVDGFNPEDHETRVIDFGIDFANREVTLNIDMTVSGSWDNNVKSTNDYFSLSANGQEVDVNYYASKSRGHESDDVTVISSRGTDLSYEYKVYLDDEGKVELDFMVASTASNETVDVTNIQAVFEGESGWVKEETFTETYTESMLVDAAGDLVSPQDIPDGVPRKLVDVESDPIDIEFPVDIAAALADTDGSESLSVTISGVPAGAS